MSLIMFFGATTFLILFGFVFVGLTIRHHWKNSKKSVSKPEEKK